MVSWPRLLRADACAAMLNFDIADRPVYHGLELQWFDDAAHGTGMLVFLGHRDSHVFDYYAQRGLRLDPADYQIGAGTGAWSRRTLQTRSWRSPTTASMSPPSLRTWTAARSRCESTTVTAALVGAADCWRR